MLQFIKCLVISILLIFWLPIPSAGQTQVPETFLPAKLVKENKVVYERFEGDFKSSLENITVSNKDARRYLNEVFTDRNEMLQHSLSNGEYLFDSYLQEYVNGVLKVILENNASIRKDMMILVSRNPVVNALSIGSGIIIVYAGLLNRLENEAQLAFVLCHEIAHDQEGHLNKRLDSDVDKYFNKEFRKKLKNVLQEEYMVKQKLTDLVMPDLLVEMRYNRHYEMEADSIGLRYFLNTPYDPQAAVTLMEVLSHSDEEVDMSMINIRETFSSDSVPFRKSWLYYKENSSLGTFEESYDDQDDSLKTHPDTKLRAASISDIIAYKGKNSGKKFIQPEIGFAHMKFAAEGEIVERYLEANQVARAAFLALQMQKHWPHDTIYARSVISHSFTLISWNQRNQALGKILTLPSIYYNENYNRIVSFLWELNIQESAGIGNYFLLNDENGLLKNENVMMSNIVHNYLYKNKTTFDRLKLAYIDRFPEGRFNRKLENLTIETNKK